MKRVLFIGIGFYDYEKVIIDEFQNLNYIVDYFCEVPPNNYKYRFHSRIRNKNKIKSIEKNHILKIANQCNSNYDLVFIIKCECTTVEALNIIKNKNVNAKYVLYLWDSIQRIKNITSKFQYFDEIYSFDRLDCMENLKLIFNPLFIRKEYLNTRENKEKKYDIYHLGWYHSDRLELLKKIAKQCQQKNLKYNMLLFVGRFSYLIQVVFGGALKGNRQFLVFKPSSAKTNKNYILESRAILDIAHPNQSGLTMRTIELLGMQQKIITTNSDIKNYDFYHPNNVLVIDRENPHIDIEFIEKPYLPNSQLLISNYSITNWLKKMLNI